MIPVPYDFLIESKGLEGLSVLPGATNTVYHQLFEMLFTCV